ncbi:MAG: hypothetical protein GY797_04775 [Deltaproteobacteria bacterium]|nr:hypothetical protein [Deltaproteobacteria bacterium]
MKQLKYRDILNRVVGYLYFQKFDGNTGFFGLTTILSAMEYPSSKEEINDIGKYLETKDYIKALFQIDDVYVQIVTQGIIYAEDLIENGVIKEDYIRSIIRLVKQKAQSESDIERPDKKQIQERRKNLFNTLTKMKKKLGTSVSPEIYDLKLDIDIIKIELQKISPDRDIIKQKMMKLDYNNHIVNEVNTLYHSLNIY